MKALARKGDPNSGEHLSTRRKTQTKVWRGAAGNTHTRRGGQACTGKTRGGQDETHPTGGVRAGKEKWGQLLGPKGAEKKAFTFKAQGGKRGVKLRGETHPKRVSNGQRKGPRWKKAARSGGAKRFIRHVSGCRREIRFGQEMRKSRTL